MNAAVTPDLTKNVSGDDSESRPRHLSLRRLRNLARDERGDVPGWVLITLMTAGLVVLIWALAGPALSQLFEQAIAQVSGF
ncbi:MAG TPA: hypothetical protein DCR63_02605 [Microbacterium sp.]|nr:hypothetical protein [Microbacterium sp.]